MSQPSISITQPPITVRSLLVVPDEPQPETCILCGGKSFVIRVLRGSMQERTTWACATCHPETVESNGTIYHYGDVTAIRKAITDALQEPDGETSQPAVEKKAKINLYCPPPSVREVHKTIAVFSDARLYIFERDDTTLVPSPAVAYTIDAEMDIPGLVALLEQHNCISCWLISGARFPGNQDVPLVRDFAKRANATKLSTRERSFTPLTGQKRVLAGLTVKKLRDGKPYGLPTMIYCVWTNTWNCSDVFSLTSGLDRARVLAGSIFLTERLLGVVLRYSASWTGHTLLRDTLRHWDKYIDFPQLTDETCELIEEHRTSWPLWTRVPTLVDCYQYDRNWSFVSSAREVPVGNPFHVTTYDFEKHGKLQGFYLLSAQAPANNWPSTWPGPFRDADGNYPTQVKNIWSWTPLINLARRYGWAVQIHEGYAWQQSQKHDLFRLWQEKLWSARRTAEQYKEKETGLSQTVATIAIKIMKLIGVAAIGKLLQRESSYLMDMDEAEEQGKHIVTLERTNKFELTGRAQVIDERASDLYQPGWWNMIISQQSERVLNALYTYAQSDCIGIYVDCLYTERPIPSLAGDKLKTGGFRLAGVSHGLTPGQALSPKELAVLHKQGKDLPEWIAA